MEYRTKGVIPIQQGQSGTFYINLPSQSAPSGPTAGQQEEPFDLTGLTDAVVSFPGGVSLDNSGSTPAVDVQGAPGAGKLKVAYAALDSLSMQANPVAQQNQDLQAMVSLNAVAQVNVLSFGLTPVPGTTYTLTLNGQTFSYVASTGDTASSVFTAFQAAIVAYQATAPSPPLNITPTITGGAGDAATLTLTSSFAGLGFSIAVSSGITDTASAANAGTISVFVLKFALNISPQSYVVT